jgi:hypothetical protein
MTLNAVALSIHVVTSILGLGQVAGIAVLASSMPAGASALPSIWTALQRLARGATWSLPVMLLSGALLEYSVAWGHHTEWWFRLSFVLFLALGALLGATRRALRRLDSATDAGPLQGVARRAWAMCAVVAIIAFLMAAKPW